MESKFNTKKSLIFFSSLCIFSLINLVDRVSSSQPDLKTPITIGQKSEKTELQTKVIKALSEGNAEQLKAIIIDNRFLSKPR
jgi:hypothetical protein